MKFILICNICIYLQLISNCKYSIYKCTYNGHSSFPKLFFNGMSLADFVLQKHNRHIFKLILHFVSYNTIFIALRKMINNIIFPCAIKMILYSAKGNIKVIFLVKMFNVATSKYMLYLFCKM